MRLQLIATMAFGLEAVVKREIENLGYEILFTENGKVTFAGDQRAVVRANLWLRSADRVLICLDEFHVTEPEELFQRVGGMEWEKWIPMDGRFVVTCTAVKSALRSEPNNQKTIKKAIALRLGDFYGLEQMPESGVEYVIKASFLKDRLTLTLDTTGESLHKRGYRVKTVPAPVKETLAAAMIQLTYWREGRLLVDPCCGSGTIPIEAALIGRNIAPGLTRHFAAENWDLWSKELWKEERQRAYSLMEYDKDIRIAAGDIDKGAVAAAKANAEEAGVDDCIKFFSGDAAKLKVPEDYGIMVTNPPYGQRIGEKTEIQRLYKGFHRFFHDNPTWSLFTITTDRTIEEKIMARKADRRRKLYNGRLEVTYYQFHGQRPPRRND